VDHIYYYCDRRNLKDDTSEFKKKRKESEAMIFRLQAFQERPQKEKESQWQAV
jgi:hypothetical protein